MNCPECQDLLQERLDGRAPADRAALEDHLRGCADCRERHLAAQRLTEGLRRLPAPAPSPGLTGRIVAQVLAERRAALRFRRRVWAAAVAAGLLLMAFASYQGYRLGLFGTDDQKPQQAKKDGPPQKKKDQRRPDSSLRQLLEEAGSVAFDLTRRTAGKTVAQARRWLPSPSFKGPSPSLKGSDPLAPVFNTPAQSVQQAGQTVLAGLKPVTSSWGRAVKLFLQDWPGVSAKETTGS
jgi:hypothetical protein